MPSISTTSPPRLAILRSAVGVQANVHRLVRMKVHRFECGVGVGSASLLMLVRGGREAAVGGLGSASLIGVAAVSSAVRVRRDKPAGDREGDRAQSSDGQQVPRGLCFGRAAERHVAYAHPPRDTALPLERPPHHQTPEVTLTAGHSFSVLYRRRGTSGTIGAMAEKKSINLRFDEDELALVRDRAARLGVSLQQYLHNLAMNEVNEI